jgi:hypothetical protein
MKKSIILCLKKYKESLEMLVSKVLLLLTLLLLLSSLFHIIIVFIIIGDNVEEVV